MIPLILAQTIVDRAAKFRPPFHVVSLLHGGKVRAPPVSNIRAALRDVRTNRISGHSVAHAIEDADHKIVADAEELAALDLRSINDNW